MKREDQLKIWNSHQVIVEHGSMSSESTCGGIDFDCENHDTYLIFVGGTKLSDLFSCSCATHLAQNIDAAIKYRHELCENDIKRIDERELEEAKKIVAEHINPLGIFDELNKHI